MRWIKKWWWLTLVILAVTSVIGWREERCQAQDDECRASYEAQAQSERIGAGRLTVNQQASEEQAIAAACEPNGFFCRFFSPANLPNILLVLIGVGGVIAALVTLRSIKTQTVHLSRQADYLGQQTHIQETAARQWLLIGGWKQHRVDGHPDTIRTLFEITNPTSAPLWVDVIYCDVNGQTPHSGLGTYLVPESPYLSEFVFGIKPNQIAHYEDGNGVGLVLHVVLSVFFRDTFDNHWEQTFDGYFVFRQPNNYLFVRESRTSVRSSEAPPTKEEAAKDETDEAN